MQMKHILISTLIAAAAMGLSLRAETKPLLNEQELPADAKNTLALADAPAAEDADAAAEETQDADALELLLADDALVELDEAAAPDELSTETMMREWIARYAAAARFAGIRSVKGTGGGLSSGGAVATAGADFAISAAAPTPSVSVPAAGTVSLADTLTRASAAGVSLGSARASDAGTASVATASSASGTSKILPAAFFSTRSVFSVVPAAAASYSLTGSSGVSAYTAETTSEATLPTVAWSPLDSNDLPTTDGTFETVEISSKTLNKNTIFTVGADSAAVVATDGFNVKYEGSGEKNLTGSVSGTGNVWFGSGHFRVTENFFSGLTGQLYILGSSQIQFIADQTLSNDVFLGKSDITGVGGGGILNGSTMRVGVWGGSANVAFQGVTTILSDTRIAFQAGKEDDKSTVSSLTLSTLTGSGNLSLSVYSGLGTLSVMSATDYTGKIDVASGVTLYWGSSTATFGGLSGSGTISPFSSLNIKDAKEGSTFTGTVGSSTQGVNLTLSGSGTQAFTGTSWFSSVSVNGGTLSLGSTTSVTGDVSVSNGTLDVSSGTHTFGGTFTTGENTTLALGSVSADSAALSATGNVTLSQSTIFDIASYVANAKLVSSSSGTLAFSSGSAENMGIANLYSGGYLVNQRGTAIFEVTNNTLVLAYTAGEAWNITWAGGDSGVWKANGSGWVKTDESSISANFQNGDSVTFATNAAVAVSESGVTAETVTVAAGTVTLSGGKVSATNGFVVKDGATLKLGRDNADAAKATLESRAVYAIDSSANTNELSLANVSGAEGSKIAIAASATSGWGTAYNFTKINALGSGFSGSLGVTAGYLNVSNPNVVNNSNVKNVILEGGNDSGLCFLTSSTTFTKDIVAEGTGGALRSYANNNYKVTFSGTVTGTAIRHWDGGTHTFTNTVNLDSFSADAGVTVFSGETTIGQMNFNGGTVKVTNGTVLDLTNNENNRTGTYGSSSILMIDGEKSTVKISTGTWKTGTSLGTAYAQSQLQISNGGTLEVTLAQKNEGEYASKRGFSITGGEGTYRYSGTETSYVTHNDDKDAATHYIGLADGKNSTLIFEVVKAGATLEVTKVVADTSSSSTKTDGALKKTGAGTLVLTPNGGANNFTGSVTIAEGKLVAGSAKALGTGADTNVVKIAGGQLEIANGVTLAQKNVEIALGEAYKTTNGAAVAAISGADKLASGTTITLSLENEAMNVAAEAAQNSYKIYDGTLADGVTIRLSDSLARLWKLEAVAGQDGVYALVAIPEPSLFGLLAGATALGFSMSSRRRRKKP